MRGCACAGSLWILFDCHRYKIFPKYVSWNNRYPCHPCLRNDGHSQHFEVCPSGIHLNGVQSLFNFFSATANYFQFTFRHSTCYIVFSFQPQCVVPTLSAVLSCHQVALQVDLAGHSAYERALVLKSAVWPAAWLAMLKALLSCHTALVLLSRFAAELVDAGGLQGFWNDQPILDFAKRCGTLIFLQIVDLVFGCPCAKH